MDSLPPELEAQIQGYLGLRDYGALSQVSRMNREYYADWSKYGAYCFDASVEDLVDRNAWDCIETRLETNSLNIFQLGNLFNALPAGKKDLIVKTVKVMDRYHLYFMGSTFYHMFFNVVEASGPYEKLDILLENMPSADVNEVYEYIYKQIVQRGNKYLQDYLVSRGPKHTRAEIANMHMFVGVLIPELEAMGLVKSPSISVV